MDASRVNEVSGGVKVMLIVQLVFLGLGAVVEVVNLHHVIFVADLHGGELAKDIIMHTVTLLMFAILALYATVGWKKTGTVHFRGVLLMFLVTVIADITSLYHDISSVGIGILAVLGMFIVLLHQKLRDERDAELINGAIIALSIAFTVLLILDKVPIDGADYFWKIFRFSILLIAICVAVDYECNFDRINFRKKRHS